jgi:hypothetical protein
MSYEILKEDGYALLKEDGYALLLEFTSRTGLSAVFPNRYLFVPDETRILPDEHGHLIPQENTRFPQGEHSRPVYGGYRR